MIETQLYALFNSIGISPNRQGYCYLIYLTKLCISNRQHPFPCMKDLYRETAVHFHVSPSIIEYNIRTVVRCYWNQKNSREIFSSITHYPVTYDLTVKEFVSILTVYILMNTP